MDQPLCDTLIEAVFTLRQYDDKSKIVKQYMVIYPQE